MSIQEISEKGVFVIVNLRTI